ncbi:hypothetical protein [Dyadobacter sp. CY347]|uniref:hypothetical protein n=1 Tax=Dyadobacter sp. CY347 TaxID=2909336 RepID=UPI001F3FAD13|nr:hypothetical protein [Dyadobacter sp. CY347]MCF2487862.1 hypothetical protein [Dyadobacter sp. CY347]
MAFIVIKPKNRPGVQNGTLINDCFEKGYITNVCIGVITPYPNPSRCGWNRTNRVPERYIFNLFGKRLTLPALPAFNGSNMMPKAPLNFA